MTNTIRIVQSFIRGKNPDPALCEDIIQPKAQSLIEESHALLVRMLGDYVLEAHEDSAAGSEVVLATALTDQGEVVGAAQGLLLNAGSRMRIAQRLRRGNTSNRRTQEAVELLAAPELPVGNMFSLAVAPETRGRGIARELIFAREEWLARQGARIIVVEAWHNPAEPDARRLYAGLGYFLVDSLPGYWSVSELGDRDPDCQRCTFCGAICRCTASVYAKIPSIPAPSPSASENT